MTLASNPLRSVSTFAAPMLVAVLMAATASTAHAEIVVCGDGQQHATELCDDGNTVDDDGCDASCTPSGIAAMSHGDGTACAVTLAGNVKCWGLNDHGQLGLGHTLVVGDDEDPSDVPFVDLGGSAATAVHTNGEQTFALMTDGSVRAWGLNDASQLGLGHTADIGDDESPATATVSTTPQIGGTVVELSAHGYFACARLDDGAVRCWGANDRGQLGYAHTNTIGDDEHPSAAGNVALGGVAVGLATGSEHACALLGDGGVRCWGANDYGQLGYGHTAMIGDDEHPSTAGEIAFDDRAAVQLIAGARHTCALLDDGAVRCWGDNSRGQLGYSGLDAVGDDESLSDAGDLSLPAPAVSISAGRAHTCALLQDGALYCWGANDFGQLGRGTVDDAVTLTSTTATDLGGMTIEVLYTGATAEKTCALMNDSAVHCWGANDVGQLGRGDTTLAISGSESIFVDLMDETIE
ncbi:MAG: hypothetical protein K0V04_34580 [Deltaproteobacteria bacterium]|nr:hypothetical protein [Deltaproteobacteria bacterium]